MSLKAVGITAEYNPFHNGHKYHLQEAKRKTSADVTVCVISGDFTQRGEPAILDKWKRAELAVRNGADLVVEMPTLFAVNNAGIFSACGVKILENLGVSWVAFGCEAEESQEALLQKIANELRNNNIEIEEEIKKGIKEGLSYPESRNRVLDRRLGAELGHILKSPNNILAIEYLKAMKYAEPIFIRRKGRGYNDQDTSQCLPQRDAIDASFKDDLKNNLDQYYVQNFKKGCEEDFASATGIRTLMEDGKSTSPFVPLNVAECLEQAKKPSEIKDRLFELLKFKAVSTSDDTINSFYGAEEGLGCKLKNEIRLAKSLDDITDRLKSKRYTRTRISRTLISIILGITRDDVKNAVTYMRVLAFNQIGSKYLKQIKNSETSEIPIITNMNKELQNNPEIEGTIKYDILASDIYNIVTEQDAYSNSDYVKRVIPVK